MITYQVRGAIRALPGKTVQPWRDGDERCHCTHCDLCGDLYPTSVHSQHVTECNAALLKALTDAARIAELEAALARAERKAEYYASGEAACFADGAG